MNNILQILAEQIHNKLPTSLKYPYTCEDDGGTFVLTIKYNQSGMSFQTNIITNDKPINIKKPVTDIIESTTWDDISQNVNIKDINISQQTDAQSKSDSKTSQEQIQENQEKLSPEEQSEKQLKEDQLEEKSKEKEPAPESKSILNDEKSNIIQSTLEAIQKDFHPLNDMINNIDDDPRWNVTSSENVSLKDNHQNQNQDKDDNKDDNNQSKESSDDNSSDSSHNNSHNEDNSPENIADDEQIIDTNADEQIRKLEEEYHKKEFPEESYEPFVEEKGCLANIDNYQITPLMHDFQLGEDADPEYDKYVNPHYAFISDFFPVNNMGINRLMRTIKKIKDQNISNTTVEDIYKHWLIYLRNHNQEYYKYDWRNINELGEFLNKDLDKETLDQYLATVNDSTLMYDEINDKIKSEAEFQEKVQKLLESGQYKSDIDPDLIKMLVTNQPNENGEDNNKDNENNNDNNQEQDTTENQIAHTCESTNEENISNENISNEISEENNQINADNDSDNVSTDNNNIDSNIDDDGFCALPQNKHLYNF